MTGYAPASNSGQVERRRDNGSAMPDLLQFGGDNDGNRPRTYQTETQAPHRFINPLVNLRFVVNWPL